MKIVAADAERCRRTVHMIPGKITKELQSNSQNILGRVVAWVMTNTSHSNTFKKCSDQKHIIKMVMILL